VTEREKRGEEKGREGEKKRRKEKKRKEVEEKGRGCQYATVCCAVRVVCIVGGRIEVKEETKRRGQKQRGREGISRGQDELTSYPPPVVMRGFVNTLSWGSGKAYTGLAPFLGTYFDLYSDGSGFASLLGHSKALFGAYPVWPFALAMMEGVSLGYLGLPKAS